MKEAMHYGQHSYYDMSNLNARWDRDWPGGYPKGPVAGLGGGSLGTAGNGMGVLGQATAERQTGNYPWGEKSEDTLAAQQVLNKKHRENKFALLTEDGKLGPATCGSMRLFKYPWANPPGTCQSFKPPGAAGAAAPSPFVPPAPLEPLEPEPAYRAGVGGRPWLLIGGAVGLLAVTLALVASKKKD